MGMYKVRLVQPYGEWFTVEDTVKAGGSSEAVGKFLCKHFSRNAFFHYNRELSRGGSRLFGQVFKPSGKNQATSLTGNCYIDCDEV